MSDLPPATPDEAADLPEQERGLGVFAGRRFGREPELIRRRREEPVAPPVRPRPEGQVDLQPKTLDPVHRVAGDSGVYLPQTPPRAIGMATDYGDRPEPEVIAGVPIEDFGTPVRTPGRVEPTSDAGVGVVKSAVDGLGRLIGGAGHAYAILARAGTRDERTALALNMLGQTPPGQMTPDLAGAHNRNEAQRVLGNEYDWENFGWRPGRTPGQLSDPLLRGTETAAGFLSAAAERMGYRPSLPHQQVLDLFKQGNYGELATLLPRYGAETLISSYPEMVASYLNPFLGAATIGEGIAQSRRQNGSTAGGTADFAFAMPFALASALVERWGTGKLVERFGDAGARRLLEMSGRLGPSLSASAVRAAAVPVGAAGRLAVKGVQEAGQEAVQEPIEYLGEATGTENAPTAQGAADRAILGGLGGMGMAGNIGAAQALTERNPALNRLSQEHLGAFQAAVARGDMGAAGKAMAGAVRHLGLPPEVATMVEDRLENGKHDAEYMRGLISFAMDTDWGVAPHRLFHEVVHAFRDPSLGLLGDRENKALERAADQWMAQPVSQETTRPGAAPRRGETNGAYLGRLNEMTSEQAASPAGQTKLREEAISHIGEVFLNRQAKPRTVAERAIERIANFGRGVGQSLRGQGFHTSDDVFRSFLEGGRQGRPGMPDLGLRDQATPEQASRRDPKLDRSPEARAARAEEQGYGPTRYHGTSADADFKAFRQKDRGVWTADDPAGASEYATSNDSQGYRHNPDTGRLEATNTAARVLPVRSRASNVYRMTPEDTAALHAASGSSPNGYQKAQAALFRQLAGKGFDAVDMGGGVQADLDRRNLRSTAADFDPKRQGEPDLLASRRDQGDAPWAATPPSAASPTTPSKSGPASRMEAGSATASNTSPPASPSPASATPTSRAPAQAPSSGTKASPASPRQRTRTVSLKVDSLRISVPPTVSDAFAHEVIESVKRMGSPVLRQALADHGIELHLGHSVEIARADVAHQQPRGWDAGSTMANVRGFYEPATKRAWVFQNYRSQKDGSLVATSDADSLTRHELGHALDATLGRISADPEFGLPWHRDVDGMPWHIKGELRYYTTNDNKLAARSEAFAELAGSWHAEASLISTAMPTTRRMMQHRVRQLLYGPDRPKVSVPAATLDYRQRMREINSLVAELSDLRREVKIRAVARTPEGESHRTPVKGADGLWQSRWRHLMLPEERDAYERAEAQELALWDAADVLTDQHKAAEQDFRQKLDAQKAKHPQLINHQTGWPVLASARDLPTIKVEPALPLAGDDLRERRALAKTLIRTVGRRHPEGVQNAALGRSIRIGKTAAGKIVSHASDALIGLLPRLDDLLAAAVPYRPTEEAREDDQGSGDIHHLSVEVDDGQTTEPYRFVVKEKNGSDLHLYDFGTRRGAAQASARDETKTKPGRLMPTDLADMMGFTTPAFHLTRGDFRHFDPSAGEGFGVHVGTAEAANARGRRARGEERYRDGANVMPLRVKLGNAIDLPDPGVWVDPRRVALNWMRPANDKAAPGHVYQHLSSVPMPADLEQNISRLLEEWEAHSIAHQAGTMPPWGNESDRSIQAQDWFAPRLRQAFRDAGIDSVSYRNAVEDRGSISHIILDPANIRSVHAKFNPWRLGESDILASAREAPNTTRAEGERLASFREVAAPKRTVTAYKLFRQGRDGQLYPLFIGAKQPVPVGRWVEAEHLPTKGFAERPGWHAGVLPTAPHLRTKAGRRAADRVWAEVEMPADKDWQAEAEASKTRDIRDRIPAGGHYRFRTNKMQGGAWLIGGALKVNRVLGDDDVRGILREAGQPAAEVDAETLASMREAPGTPAFQRWFKGSKVVDAHGRPLVVYHGTTHDFDAFNPGRANIENDLGAASYFTNNRDDVAINYAGHGPDLTNRIERLADIIAQDDEFEGDEEEAKRLARERLSGHDGMTMPVYLSIKKPAVIGGLHPTMLTFREPYNRRTDTYGEPRGTLLKLIEGLRSVAGNFMDFDPDVAIAALTEAAFENDGELSVGKAISIIKEYASEAVDYDSEHGDMAAGEVARAALEAAGFDGIIDHTVSEKFRSMAGMTRSTTHYLAFKPTQIKSAIGNNGKYSPRNPSILASTREPAFYSALTRAVGAMTQAKGPPQQWIGQLRNLTQKGVKQEELDWSGVIPWLQEQRGAVTRDAVEQYLRENEVKIGEVALGGNAARHEAEHRAAGHELEALMAPTDTPDDEDYGRTVEVDGDEYHPAELRVALRGGEVEVDDLPEALRPAAQRFMDSFAAIRRIGSAPQTRYAQYSTPGGENYRELLLTLPPSPAMAERQRVFADYEERLNDLHARGMQTRLSDPEENARLHDQYNALMREREDALAKLDAKARSDDYTSSHWDTPNVLAHTRVSDRRSPDGKRVLLVDEVQSDWHQAGRKGGYGGKPVTKWMVIDGDRNQRGNFDSEAGARAYLANPPPWLNVEGARVESREEVSPGAVPDAPFKQSWPLLVMKRMLREAVEGGFDRIAWTGGSANAQRYSLEKQVGQLIYYPGGVGRGTFLALPPGASVDTFSGRPIIEEDDVGPERIAALVGQEMADRLLAQPLDPMNGFHVLEGEDLKLGGEGMRKFYDKMLPAEMSKYIKKWGGKVGQSRIITDDAKASRADNELLEALGVEPPGTADQRDGPGMQRVHSIDITPTMRESLEKAQPLFSRRDRGYGARTDTPEFLAWWRDSKVVDENGRPLRVYHGTGRPDRVGSRFRKSRATSGPMSYFTDAPWMASSYAQNKADTSRDDDTSFPEWFKVSVPGFRRPFALDQAWHYLPADEKARIAELAPRVSKDDDDNILLEPEGRKSGLGGYEQHIKEARGNHLKALLSEWVESAALFNEEEDRFPEVLKLAGMTTPFTMRDPNGTDPFVYPVYLSIQNPLDTHNIPPEVVEALDAASRRQRFRHREGLDMWHKKNRHPGDWVSVLKADIADGRNSHAWTSVPDWVTSTLQGLGYDGIRDRGGKNGGQDHAVWIPFDDTQVKSAVGNKGSFDPTNPNILRSTRDPAFYSALTRGVEAMQQAKGPPQQWIGQIRNLTQKGVKQEEVNWSGVVPWLQEQHGPVTKDQVVEFLRENEVKVEEVMLSGHAVEPDLRWGDWERQEGEWVDGEPESEDEDGELIEGTEGYYEESTEATANVEDRDSGEEFIVTADPDAGSLYIQRDGGAFIDSTWDGRGGMRGAMRAAEEAISDWLVDKKDDGAAGPAKYSEYKTTGGENYRELLLTMPVPKRPKRRQLQLWENGEVAAVGDDAARDRWLAANPNADVREAWIKDTRANKAPGEYRSSHWDDTNVVAHTRFTERVSPDGKRALHVEEVQSDWHQAGRKHGYKDGHEQQEVAAAEERYSAAHLRHAEVRSRVFAAVMDKLVAEGGGVEGARKKIEFTANDRLAEMVGMRDEYDAAAHAMQEARAHQLKVSERAVNRPPEAPFKQSWPLLVLKRMIRWAAENDFDRLTWATGEQSAGHYGMERRVRTVIYDPDGGRLVAHGEGGASLIDQTGVTPDKLGDYIGAELADKLLATEKSDMPMLDERGSIKVHRLDGPDLKVGGEGMKAFYDKMLPNEVAKYVKRWGAKVGRSEVEVEPGAEAKRRSGMPPPRNYRPEPPVEVHSVDITPEMRESVMRGQPLFSKRDGGKHQPRVEKPLAHHGNVASVPGGDDERARQRRRREPSMATPINLAGGGVVPGYAGGGAVQPGGFGTPGGMPGGMTASSPAPAPSPGFGAAPAMPQGAQPQPQQQTMQVGPAFARPQYQPQGAAPQGPIHSMVQQQGYSGGLGSADPAIRGAVQAMELWHAAGQLTRGER